MVGLGLRFDIPGVDLDRKIWRSAHLCREVKFSWTVATALFIALHDSLMLVQWSEALPFL